MSAQILAIIQTSYVIIFAESVNVNKSKLTFGFVFVYVMLGRGSDLSRILNEIPEQVYTALKNSCRLENIIHISAN